MSHPSPFPLTKSASLCDEQPPLALIAFSLIHVPFGSTLREAHCRLIHLAFETFGARALYLLVLTLISGGTRFVGMPLELFDRVSFANLAPRH